MIGITVVGLLIILLIIGVLFVNLSPVFGGKATKDQKEGFAKSTNYHNDKFVNKGDVKLDLSFKDYLEFTVKYFSEQPNTIPIGPIPVEKIDSASVASYNSSDCRIIWFGHSAILLQIGGKNILIDPMFGDVPAPHPWLGNSRFYKDLPINVEQLPNIDAVILSHDHYDHLDYGTIVKLKNKVDVFYTPLGVGNHLIEWGVDREHITELDWWEEVSFNDLRLICTPAQHFSGRGISDGAATLWSSWIIQSEDENIFFSGDSGYGAHFAEIGNKYGPFNFAMLECGQYNQQWVEIHMLPKQQQA